MENEELIKKAIAWWKSKRPVSFTLEDHLESPSINIRNNAGAELAIEVAQTIKEDMVGETIGDLIDTYAESKSKIFKKFGCNINWIPIRDYTEYSWEQKRDSIHCPYLKDSFYQGFRYESGDYTMIVTINDYGENEALIFDKNKNIKLDD